METSNLNIQPQLRVLSDEQIHEIRKTALSILRDTGVQVKAPRAMVLISELQVDDVTMTRLAYYLAYGCPIYMAFTPLVGGYGGGPAGTAIVAVASFIAAVLLGGEVVHVGPQHIKYKQQTNQHSLFLASLVNQAVARNSSIIATTSHTTSGRPGSEQYARELYDLQTLRPTTEHQALYDRLKEELFGMGVPL